MPQRELTASGCFGLLLLWAACTSTPNSPQAPRLSATDVFNGTPIIDGSGADAPWDTLPWYPMESLWQGQSSGAADFKGRYKICWDENNLYLLVETEDDSLREALTSQREDPLQADCLIVFIDEDVSDGDPVRDYNAFVYYILLDGRVLGRAPDSTWQFYNDHCWVRRIDRGEARSTWEMAIRVYDGKQYRRGGENIPKLLTRGKKVGFALAYGDCDGGLEWESVVGSFSLPSASTPWQTADGLSLLRLF